MLPCVFNGRIYQQRIAEPEVPMTSPIWRGSVPEFYAVRTHHRLSRSDLLLKSRNRKIDFHRVAWWGLLSHSPETASRWRHQYGGVGCPNFSWFERRLDGVDRTRLCWAAVEKRFSIDFKWRISQQRIAEPEVPMTSSIWHVSVPAFYAVRTHYRLSRSNLLLKSRNWKTDFHRVAWRGLLSPWLETGHGHSIAAKMNDLEWPLSEIQGDWFPKCCKNDEIQPSNDSDAM